MFIGKDEWNSLLEVLFVLIFLAYGILFRLSNSYGEDLF